MRDSITYTRAELDALAKREAKNHPGRYVSWSIRLRSNGDAAITGVVLAVNMKNRFGVMYEIGVVI